jgi:hypothetical protein
LVTAASADTTSCALLMGATKAAPGARSGKATCDQGTISSTEHCPHVPGRVPHTCSFQSGAASVNSAAATKLANAAAAICAARNPRFRFNRHALMLRLTHGSLEERSNMYDTQVGRLDASALYLPRCSVS